MTTAMDQQHEIELKDAAQMVIGAGAIALPVAMSKDTWEIAEELQPSDIIGITCMSALLIGGFVYAAYFRGRVREHWPLLLSRVLVIYGLTVIVASLSLLLINQAPWLTDPTLALNQTVLVALPASFAATVVDHMS
jgi:uncharacterized membrane protein